MNPAAVIDQEFRDMGVPLTASYRRTLLDRIDSGGLEPEQLLAVWRQIAQIDRWLGIEEPGDDRGGS